MAVTFFFIISTVSFREVAQAIIEDDDWLKACQSEFPSAATGVRETPLRLLIKQFPDLAKMVFDKCMETNLQTHSKQVNIFLPTLK